MTYQALQAMNSTNGFENSVVSMSDLDEAERWAQAHDGLIGVGEDTYDPDGTRAATKLFGYGSDPT